MSISDTFPLGHNGHFDYVIVGGGTAGCIIASRLSEYLPNKIILMIEAGPTDVGENRALILKDRSSMQGTELDYRYTSVKQLRGIAQNAYSCLTFTLTCFVGNSDIIHSRAKILGGCSSHNDMVSFRTPQYDAYTWEKLGCKGWSFETFARVQDKLRVTTHPSAHPRDQSQLNKDWIMSASRALGLPYVKDLNKSIRSAGGLTQSVGWTPISYNPDNGYRSSTSVAYIHPILRGEEKRPNLIILTNAWVSRVNVQGNIAVAVNVTTKDGTKHTAYAISEIILCAGAIDTPRLMLLSGLGPREHLESVGIPVVKDIPGVGENLQDHPGASVVYELHDKVPAETATHSDVLAFIRHKPYNWAGDDGNIPDLLLHTWQLDFDGGEPVVPQGYPRPQNPFGIYPLTLRPESKGRVYLRSNNPSEKPALDFRYFEDPNNYDAEILVAGIKAARQIAQSEPFKSYIKREVAPGPLVTSDRDLDKYARETSCTIYHPACTTKMGDVEKDPQAVVDSRLKVRGLLNLRIADAGVFPIMVTVNVMLTVLAVGERAAELIAEDAGWAGARHHL
ncbi:choline oxidase [Pochonia chlamydosporia 170]|uniref:Choline oxidase n=1 Tax=Pochonia chlamydosporia 170 TaxID=1380566 RepID=A0A179FB94_METCM|nr:choline oxidase [Pochonia chlamydosporia 170]OAQ62732.1 choline oxidase [Pochonia chlamydosporia 170]